MKPFPLPVHIVYNSQAWLMGNTLVKGAVMAIVIPWWLGGCKELPKEDTKLMESAGLAQMRWSRNRDNIKIGLDDLVPQLTKSFKLLTERQIRINKRNAIGAQRLIEFNRQKQLKRLEERRLSDGLQEDLDSYVADTSLVDTDNRVDRIVPSTLPYKSSPTPNSFKHRPAKSLGTLRDK